MYDTPMTTRRQPCNTMTASLMTPQFSSSAESQSCSEFLSSSGCLPCSSFKQADPLGWPFGAIDPKRLARLLKQRNQQHIDDLPEALI
jgi:hypothetical protein